jgi:hypothetical protein
MGEAMSPVTSVRLRRKVLPEPISPDASKTKILGAAHNGNGLVSVGGHIRRAGSADLLT